VGIFNRTEVARLTLRIERDLLIQNRFRMLLTNASTTLIRHRLELRAFKARLKRSEGLVILDGSQ
jgi:hypothetical protein